MLYVFYLVLQFFGPLIWCLKVCVDCLMKLATCAFLIFLLVVCGQQGGKNMFYQFSHLAAQFNNPSKCSGNMSLLLQEVEFTCSAGGFLEKRNW